MKALTYHRYGPPDVLNWSDVERSAPGPGEVLVRVRAAALNHADLLLLSGTPRIARLAFGLRRPRATILGRDVAGTVEAAGPGVTALRPGDEVFGEVEQRGFAEYVTAPAAHLAVKPSGVSFTDAATLPVAATTALQAARKAELEPGRTVLINGASGGVGTFAVQIARALGAAVTAVCSTRNAELARELGARDVIDYTRAPITGRYDAIIDLAGSRPLGEMRRRLTPRGIYVASTGNGGRILGPAPRLLGVALGGSRLRVLTARRDVGDLTTLAAMVERGEVTPVIEATYPMAEAAAALERLRREHARGKIVLSP
ncbi:NAD(P)-dependent alcohol dehydrogenase [Amorphoplanes nipponensis]|uniref:NADPH:quinone reductase n=1 Tax=Actinoplanes nipponensis TaxID=135950 RepID=A0A919MV02_9ACTN|nr:NAD(P)-dependent alcohol dehydrogenase [Actinoplanes nipponensis]GIE50675.1 NADPH:quinone reductase [Actinoplanes nipponensis]